MADHQLTGTDPTGGGPQGDDAGAGRTIIALAADMIFASKIRGAAHAVGAEVVLARNPAHVVDLIATAPEGHRITAIIDLDTRALHIDKTITEMRHANNDVRIIAYVSHVNTDAIHEARDAGADKVLARSAFTQQMADILRNA
jgi:hypothetical protein